MAKLDAPSIAITCDAHIDVPWIMTKVGHFSLLQNNHGRFSQVDIPRMKEGGLDSAIFALYLSDAKQDELGPSESINYICRQLHYLEKQHGLGIVDTPEMAIDAMQVGVTPIFLGLEGGRLIYGDLLRLRKFREFGVRYLTVTHNKSTEWADSSTDLPRHGGLTAFGRNVVHEANRIGMLIDISHASDETAWGCIGESSLPVIASHSGCKELTNNPRNLSDDLIKMIAKTDGFIGIPFARRMIGPTWRSVVDHIDHITQLVGPAYVGVGSDLDGADLATGIESVVDWRRVVIEELAERGFSRSVIQDITGGNLMRVLNEGLTASHNVRMEQ